MTMQFQKAVRRQAKLRLALSGPSGSGKTYGALQIAKGLGGKIAVIDTERGSASLYSHLVEFDTLELQPPYSPERFVEAIKAAEAAEYDVLVVDSITHEWNGSGGVLEIVDLAAKASRSGSSYNAWNEGSGRHRKFIDAMLQADCHVVATMRSKAAYVQDRNEKSGKTEIRKVGMAPEQRDGVEYEFTVLLDLVNDGNVASASKDRTGLFRDPHVITADTGKRIAAWLDSGAIPRLSDQERADHLAAIEAAADLDTLKTAFARGYTAAKKIHDAEAEASFKAKYDERKAKLAPQAHPVSQEAA